MLAFDKVFALQAILFALLLPLVLVLRDERSPGDERVDVSVE